MSGQGRPFALYALLALVSGTSALATDRYIRFSPERKAASVTPTPMQDDADLHDVQFVSRDVGWAVGDRGVIWKTTDAGRTWRLQKSPVNGPLRKLCFLTDRVGWIVGGGIEPYTRIGYGVVLFTDDGGKRWRQLVGRRKAEGGRRKADSGKRGSSGISGLSTLNSQLSSRLPSLVYVRFFSLTHGVAVGESTADFPSGVLVTKDGGRSWTAVPGKTLPGWRAADFLNPNVGAVAGLHGRLSLVGGGRMLKPAVDDLGLRGIRAIVLDRDESGWLVGDGGLVLKTENGGVVWKSPPKSPPAELQDFVDFHAVATRGDHVWIAGSPGSVVWHSPDGGKYWTPQRTGQTVPIHALRFVNRRVGWAVGALGTLLYTGDGGTTWTANRGKGRRVAILSVSSRRQSISFSLLAKMSADQGYRSAVLLPSRGDFGPDGPVDFTLDHRAAAAVAAAGGNAAVLGWRFPVALPGLDRDSKRLWADWNLRSEGRLRDVMLGSLTAAIRTWRPTVLVLDTAAEGDALTKLLNRAVITAVNQAGDPAAFPRQAELAGLGPWKVTRIFLRLPDGSSGQATVSPHEYLPYRGAVNHSVATAAEARLQPPRRPTGKHEAYHLILDRANKPDAVVKGFFSRLTLWPGTEARRKLAPVDDKDLERQLKLAERQRNFQAIVELTGHDSRMSAQLIAQLSRVTSGMDDERASVQLMKLAGEYRRHSMWELAEATWIEQVTRYPNTAAALSAMQNLFHLWGGAETAWHRAKEVGVHRSRSTRDRDLVGLHARIGRAARMLQLPPELRDASRYDLGPDPLEFLKTPDDLPKDRNGERRAKGMRHWQDQALQMAALIRKRDPRLYLEPRIQFPLAALLRSRGAWRTAQRGYQRFQRGEPGASATRALRGLTPAGSPWQKAADSEMWMLAPRGGSPRPLVVCKSAGTRPVLDGVLSDPCWENAKAVWLTSTKESRDSLGGNAFVMFAWDADYLYIAGSVPNVISPPGANAKPSNRRRDADLSLFDRIGIRLDVDRDYATWYSLDVDQRGWTHDSCWGDDSWDPKWLVAPDRDGKTWRFEAAIPLKELVPSRPRRGTTWGVGVVRTVPAIGVQSWTHPVGHTPRPESFGLLRFE
jgi:photosystem II stability/assembly factor-like uncharacterized protein